MQYVGQTKRALKTRCEEVFFQVFSDYIFLPRHCVCDKISKTPNEIVIYRVFIYLKHHVYYVSINSFIYCVSKNNFLEQHVYNNMVFTSLILD